MVFAFYISKIHFIDFGSSLSSPHKSKWTKFFQNLIHLLKLALKIMFKYKNHIHMFITLSKSPSKSEYNVYNYDGYYHSP